MRLCLSDALLDMDLLVEDEFRCPKSAYSIDIVRDMRVHDMRVNANINTGASVGWAVEFDGPSHFWACSSPLGGTMMKRRHLELLGHTLVSLPVHIFFLLLLVTHALGVESSHLRSHEM